MKNEFDLNSRMEARRMFVQIIAVITVLTVFSGYYSYQKDLANRTEQIRASEMSNILFSENILTCLSLSLISDLQNIANIMEQSIALSGKPESPQLTEMLKNISDTKAMFDQIRAIDIRGNERIRINYDKDGAYAVEPQNLQNKNRRYYFKESVALKKGEIYISPLDLNIENGKIERPFKSMIRLSMPLYVQNKKWGIAVLNYMGVKLIHQEYFLALSQVRDHAMLVNQNGYWLHHPDETREWGFMEELERSDENMQNYYPGEWARIQAEEKGQFQTRNGLFSFVTIHPWEGLKGSGSVKVGKDYYWKSIALLPHSEWSNISGESAAKITLILAPLYLIVLIGGWRFSIGYVKRKTAESALKQSHGDLEKRVKERTSELSHEINEKQKLLFEMRKQNIAIENSPISILITNEDGIIEYVNPKFTQVTGYTPREAIGNKPAIQKSGLTPPDVYEHLWNTIKAGREWRGELLNKRKDGSVYVEEVTISPVKEPYTGEITNYIALKQDITAKKIAEEEQKLIASVFEHSTEGMLITDNTGTILQVNSAFTRITGYEADEAIGQNPRMLQSGKHDKLYYENMWSSLLKKGFWEGEIINRHKSGEIYPEWLVINSVKDETGRLTHYIANFVDITERKKAEERIHHLAYYDALTGLPNRELLIDRLKNTIAQISRKNETLAVLFMDIDGFKTVNDSLGHATGDLLLEMAARRLVDIVRKGDTVARLGGDEFVVLLTDLASDNNIAAQDAAVVANNIRREINMPFKIREYQLTVTPSIGITLYPGDGKTAEELIKHADIAMYQAKDHGRNNYQFFTPKMNQRAMERLDMKNKISQALNDNQFEMFYQPQVDMKDGSPIGAEALLRWQDQDKRYIPTAYFIELAEQTGQILALGEWAMENVFYQVKAWQSYRPTESFRVAVNVSPRQFQQRGFVKSVEKLVTVSGADPHFIDLEITEGVIIHNITEVTKKLNNLKEMGFSISIDDFGIGYSSLYYLKKLPLNGLKIDQSFVQDLATDENDVAIVRTIARIAESLQYSVIAEGVEKKEQVEILQKLGCRFCQGFFYAEPMPASEFEEQVLGLTGKSHK